MHELKFRVWDGTKMVYDVVVGRFGAFYVNPGSRGDGLDEHDTASLTPLTTKYPDSTPVMQYTGLKDKNGREIYEGDILEDGGVIEFRGDLRWDSGGSVHSGFFSSKGYAYKDPGDLEYHYQIGELEVIGDIYENPELLKEVV